MDRATTILAAGTWDKQPTDEVWLTYDERHRRRFRFTAKGGLSFLLDLPRATVLQEGDGLVLEGGGVIAVRAAPEALIEARAKDAHALMRLAWHIGNRHLPADLSGEVIRLRADHVIAEMLVGLGATVREVDAPFTPEQGAYSGGGHHHHHDPFHEHDHHHDH